MPVLKQKKRPLDRKSTRLNSSHQIISYAVFCLKKKKHTESTELHNRSSVISLENLKAKMSDKCEGLDSFFFLMIRRPPRSTLFPTRRSSDPQAPLPARGRLLRARLLEGDGSEHAGGAA